MARIRPPLPPDSGTDEDENYQVDPRYAPTMPPKGDPKTGQPIGPAYAKMPRDAQRKAVDSVFRQELGNFDIAKSLKSAQDIEGSVFDTPQDRTLREAFAGAVPAGVVANPGNALFQQLAKRSPRFAGGLQKVKEVHEYLPQVPIKKIPNAWGVTSNIPQEKMRQHVLQGGTLKAKYGITPEDVHRLAQRGHGATLQSFPAGKVADETLFHEGLHSLYSKKFPLTQAPKIGRMRAFTLIERTMKRMGASDEEIIRLMQQYGNDPNHGLVEALARFQTHKTGGMSVVR